MLIAAAVCPHPPLLVPAVAAGAADELADLRAGCVAAVEAVYDARPDLLFVVGADVGLRAKSLAPWAPGSPADLAVDVPEALPLPLLIGGWLTRGRPRSFVAVDPDLDPVECAELGADLAGAARRVALLVMGDGSARHTEKAPGYVDPRAAAWDEQAHAAFATVDTAWLASIDPAAAAELLVAGRAPWQVLAGAAAAAQPPAVSAAAFRGSAECAAPYGVGYHLATWLSPSG
ncbi:MAG TPA: hypothetical protein VFT62_10675 [Mycobacteriales bacterium]|nr:hypothetical protein [Mycobacteriales bacterium]